MLRLRPKLSPIQTPDPILVSMGYERIAQTVKSLEALKEKHEEEHAQILSEIKSAHEEKMAQLDSHLGRIYHHASVIQKGEKGIDGKDAPVVNEKAIESRVLSRIRQPKDGETPIINEDSIAQKVLKKIKIPTPENGKDADEESIVEKVIESLATGKKKLNIKNIDGYSEGLEQTIAPIRSLAAGFRGGGDTVAAGSNITITTTNGIKTITSTGNGSAFQAPSSGAVNGSNATFVWATAPNVIIVDGGRAMQKVSTDGTVNWTGTTTTVLSVAPNFDIFSTN